MLTYLLPLVFMPTACKRTPPVVAADVVTTSGSSITTDAEALDALQANFERVHFLEDSSSLTDDAQLALSSNAAILQQFPRVRLEVQGHADERGTIDYNLALGQRRARSVLTYLHGQGVAPSRLEVMSYGEERPLELGASEIAWAKNRRAEFRVLEGPTTSAGTAR